MNQHKVQVLLPQGIKDFKCIGGACEDTCCGGWRVDIDEATYKKYKRIRDYELRNKINKNIVRNRSVNSSESKGKMRLEKNRCTFLTEQSLCELQLKLGEGYLCKVCRTYPRTSNKVEGRIERTMVLSCPEVARKVLLEKEPLAFEIKEEVLDLSKEVGPMISYEAEKAKGWKKYGWSIRELAIDIVQTRDLSLEERLLVLGTFFDKLSTVIKAKEEDTIPALIKRYQQNLAQQLYKGAFEDIQPFTRLQVRLCTEIVALKVERGITNQRYADCFNEMVEGLQLKATVTEQEKIKGYEQFYAQYYIPFLETHGYIIENYLVNYIFSRVMPLDQDEPFESYMQLVMHYILIKLHLVGMGKYHEGITPENALTLIQSLTKAFSHDNNYFKGLLALFEKNHFNTLAYMTILIKN